MRCPSCQHENRPAARFCAQCRTKLEQRCPECGAQVGAEDRFCDACGAELPLAMAPTAGTVPSRPPHLEAQFAALQQAMPASVREQLLTPTEGEIRLVTVLFADMSRSVQTTAELPPEDAAELVNRLLKAMVDVLLQYEGRIDRFLGDGVLAVFGVPHAHESDPDRALRAALDIREAAQQLGLEITAGINTGEVYVGGMGSERHQEVTVMGPVVNLAARLQDAAAPGQILAGEATYRHTRRAFEFSPLSLPIRGLAQSVTAYAVERALPHPEKVRGIEGLRAELIGRDEELARLKAALDGLRHGRGQMVTLIGEAGLGKSRLVAELKAVAQPRRERGGVEQDTLPDGRGSGSLPHGRGSAGRGSAPAPLWLEGRCLELGMAASYWPFLDIFRDYFGWRPEDDERARAERLVSTLQKLVARGDLQEDRFEEMVPLLGNLLSVRFGNDWDERLKNAGPEEIKHRTFLAIRDFFLALSRRQPLLLIFEDLHWADSLSLDLIALLMETVTFAPLMLLCVYRPEREHKCWHLGTIAQRKCAERCTEITLRELLPPQGRRLIESLLAIENLPASVKEAIQEKSGGNPFFVEEVVRSLIDSGMVYQEGDRWRAQEGIEAVTVPESIQSVILSRVDRLEQELKHVLQCAAVIGRLFRRRLLERVVESSGLRVESVAGRTSAGLSTLNSQLSTALWQLEDLALICQEQVVPEEEYSFKHVLTQETVYRNILRRRRSTFHQQVAEAIETLYQGSLKEYYEQLAYHYERSGSDEKAVEYLLKAGEKACRAYLNEEAISYFQRVLERLDASQSKIQNPKSKMEARLAALKALGQIHHGTGREPEAQEYLRQAVTIAKDTGLTPREMARLYWWLGDVLWWRSKFEEMHRLGEEGLALLGEDTESVEAALMNDTVAMGYDGVGNREKWSEFTSRNARFLDRLPYSEELRPAHEHVAFLGFDLKQIEEATRWLEIFGRKAGAHHDLRSLAEVHDLTGVLLGARGDLRQRVPQHEQALELYLKIGDKKHSTRAAYLLAFASLALGEIGRAEEYGSRAIPLAEGVGSDAITAIAYRGFGCIALAQGASGSAIAAFQKVVGLRQNVGDRVGEGSAVYDLGRAYLAQGDRQEALRQFQEALTRVPPRPGPLFIEFSYTFAAVLSGLEEAHGGPEEFRALCRRYREERPQMAPARFVQWYLEPAEPRSVFRSAYSVAPVVRCEIRNTQHAALDPGWSWHDPFGDCSLTVQNGLEIHAANGRDLWQINVSAPRLVRPASSDFAIQTVCLPTSDEKPAIGGLLLWKDPENFLRLERGAKGKHEITFEGCVANEHYQFGRGRLVADRVFLRLERRGPRVDAFCSADGEAWFTAGSAEFPVEDPVEAGLHAIGAINRLIYPGAYPEGTAIRFESLQLGALA